MEPREICSSAFLAKLDGGDVPDVRQHMAELGPSIDRQGSCNWPWVAAAVHGDLDWTTRALAAEKAKGLWTREAGSRTYSADLVGAKLHLLDIARRHNHPVADVLASNLRAWWAVCALAAVPCSTKEIRVKGHDGETVLPGSAKYYNGWTVALPSPRQGPSFDDMLSPLLTWAAGVGIRWDREYKKDDPRSHAYWPIKAVWLVRSSWPIDQMDGCEVWGLKPGDREKIKALVSGNGDYMPVVKMIGDWKMFGRLHITRSHYSVTSWVDSGWSSWKPTVLACTVDVDGHARMVMPQRWRKQGASLGTSRPWRTDVHEISARTLIVEADGVRYDLVLPPMETITYDLVIPQADGGTIDIPTAPKPLPIPVIPKERDMNRSIGEALLNTGFAKTIWIDKANITRRITGDFNPNFPWTGTDINRRTFEARYGAGSWDRKGDLVGERYAQDIVEIVARHPSNPMGLVNNQSYVVTEQDKTDVKLVKGIGNASVYDSYFVPKANLLEDPATRPTLPPTPPATPPITPAQPPVKPIPPQPINLKPEQRRALAAVRSALDALERTLEL